MQLEPRTPGLRVKQKAFENIVGKGKNAGNKHFLLFPIFSTLPQTEIIILATLNLSSANTFNSDQCKILS